VVTLIGNLATDVELREVGEDLQVANFLLAVNRPGKDEADFVRISTWNKQAELCAQYLAKGRKVGVDGRLRSSSWETPTGTSGTRSRSWQIGSSSSRRRERRRPRTSRSKHPHQPRKAP
jgi:single stranded DNA-binding protein